MSTILQHPVDTPTLTLTLPSPDLGDVERIPYSNLFGENRTNAQLNVYDAGHPTPKTLDWTIKGFNLVTRDALREFLETTLGDRIKVTDYNSNVFNAIIVSKDVDERTIRDECFYSVTFQLMVVT
jgi:hypothetical protein